MPDPTPPPMPAKRRFGCLLPLALILFVSLLLNLYLALVWVGALANPLSTDTHGVTERFLLGDEEATDKVAVVRVEGVISDGTIGYPIRQLERAAKDKRVKAVVLRIDSPGGTVTASEELYQNIINLRDATGRRFKSSGAKPVAVSMGGLAASGGYYIATAGRPISAERTTITGSIGVFAALPNVSELGQKHGVRVEMVKAGGIKAAGSFFHALSQEERQTWQDTVDNAYDVFLGVIASGRPGLTREALRSEVVVNRDVDKRDEKGNPVVEKGERVKVKYTRVRADGGTFTSEEAVRLKLIDKVEDLPAAIRAAASSAGISSFKAVVYDRPATLFDTLTGGRLAVPTQPFDLSNSLTPRLWYLTPSADGGILIP
jgi:protease-4